MYLCGQFMDYKMIHIEETDSTNRWMKEMKQGNGSFVTSRDVTKEPFPCFISFIQRLVESVSSI